jgi:hypothetical protein
MHEKVTKSAPQWRAPETLLPRVLMAVATPPRTPAVSPFSRTGIVVTLLLCIGTGAGLAAVLGIVALPSAKSVADSVVNVLDLLIIAERVISDLFSALLGNRIFSIGALIYGIIMVPAGLAGMYAIAFFVNTTPQSRRSLL